MTSSSSTRTRPAPARAGRSRGAGGTLVGIFIGLVLGLALAAAVAYYLMGGRSAYQAQVTTNKDVREPVREPAKTAATDKDKAAEKPRFDFYKILPGGEEPKVAGERKAPDKPDRAVADKAAAKTADAAPKAADKGAEKTAEKAQEKAPERTPDKVASVDPNKAAKSGDRFWLQAGSFAQQADAENLKAQLALAGWEAGVQAGMMPDKAVRYRVRLGPYDNTDELNRVKGQLGQRGFDAVVIKY
jgi:cell division protein FtsN